MKQTNGIVNITPKKNLYKIAKKKWIFVEIFLTQTGISPCAFFVFLYNYVR